MTEEQRYTYEGPEELAGTILEALKGVVDPEISINIVDVGLVYGVAVRGDTVHVEVTMTSAACPVADVILEDIGFQVDAAVGPRYHTQAELVWEPPWSPERLSERARRFMGW
ncbi:MAG: metal-sulfur cluster assembly factor [Burkholderiales bacterium]|nr:metal-sulfur cluster assembly factor [Burkholderiales bacterium]